MSKDPRKRDDEQEAAPPPRHNPLEPHPNNPAQLNRDNVNPNIPPAEPQRLREMQAQREAMEKAAEIGEPEGARIIPPNDGGGVAPTPNEIVDPQALPEGGSVASINEPPGSDVLTLRFSVTGIDPATAEHSGEDVVVNVTGTGFEDGAQVVVDGTPVQTAFVSDTNLTGTIPAATAAGTAQVSVAQSNFVCEPMQTFTWTDPVEARRGKRRGRDED